jgi:hypothetical protein
MPSLEGSPPMAMPTTTRKSFSFTFTLGSIPAAVSHTKFRQIAEEIMIASRGDATPALQGGRVFVSFSRKSRSLSGALGSAIRDIQNLGLKVTNVEMHDEVESA